MSQPTLRDMLAAISSRLDEIEASQQTGAAGPVKARKPKKPATPDWIVQHGINKAARRALAASLRAKGIDPKGAAWTKAKKAAGIK